eukprot:6849379-Prymnesium_polylepis.1
MSTRLVRVIEGASSFGEFRRSRLSLVAWSCRFWRFYLRSKYRRPNNGEIHGGSENPPWSVGTSCLAARVPGYETQNPLTGSEGECICRSDVRT